MNPTNEDTAVSQSLASIFPSTAPAPKRRLLIVDAETPPMELTAAPAPLLPVPPAALALVVESPLNLPLAPELVSPVVAKAPKEEPAPAAPMTLEEAKALVASYEGRRGRRPAAYHEALKLVGPPPAEEPVTPAVEAQPAKVMTVEEAKVYIASFEGRRGRRPAAYHEALELVAAAAEATK